MSKHPLADLPSGEPDAEVHDEGVLGFALITHVRHPKDGWPLTLDSPIMSETIIAHPLAVTVRAYLIACVTVPISLT